ncbi:MAG TPA: hypothetical protein VN851_01175, partial [Thermoanaerobaculia bacterium]|nr:hypothetical protein [Thermoanaerobaculia bacterium]
SDILDYKARHPIFPQESTADQFFTESQFESYRKLGHSIATKIFKPLIRRFGRGEPASLIEALLAAHSLSPKTPEKESGPPQKPRRARKPKAEADPSRA